MAEPRRIQVCRGNCLGCRPDLLELLRRQGYRVEVEECMDECTRAGAFALVNGRPVLAATPEEFVRRMEP